MIFRLIHADVLNGLRMLADQSIQTCVTSPPYWGLRDYGIEPSVWGGDPEHEHVYGASLTIRKGGPPGATSAFALGNRAVIGAQVAMNSRVVEGPCECGAWRGCLGLEPTPELFVQHIVLVFREVWRVLRDDGTLWLNLGDSYAGSGKGGNPEAGKQATNAGSQSIGVLYGKIGDTAREAAVTNVSRLTFPESGIKAKDLIGIPWMTAFALRSDGWYLRSEIIWHKPGPMPESVTDRPTRSHEQIFLLAKSPRYFYDAAAIAERVTESSRARLAQDVESQAGSGRANGGTKTNGPMRAVGTPETRNKRDVWTVPSAPFREAHFATFAPDLIEPCILAGSRIGDIVLDPFSGSGTTGEVALSHQRDYVGIERNGEYVEMSRRRLEKVAPMFAREESQLDERVGV